MVPSRVSTLKQNYVRSFMQKIERLNRALERYEVRYEGRYGTPGDTAPQTNELYMLLHKLAGSLGMYDFHQLTEQARRAATMAKTGDDPAGLRSEVKQLIEDMTTLYKAQQPLE